MIELQQFLLWILRKIMAKPRHWFDTVTGYFEFSDWPIPVLLISMFIAVVGFCFGIAFAALGRSDIGAIFLIAIWGGGIAFIVAAGVRAMWRAFKEEQKEFIDTLKR